MRCGQILQFFDHPRPIFLKAQKYPPYLKQILPLLPFVVTLVNCLATASFTSQAINGNLR